jgi:hypothetical protein
MARSDEPNASAPDASATPAPESTPKSTPKSTPRPSLSAFADACRLVCEEQGWELLPTGIVVRWGDGRHQLVSLEHFEFEREELVRLSTRIGESDHLGRDQLALALETNSGLAHGALSISENHLCMTDTLLVSSADGSHIAAAVEYLARQADEYERAIYGTDDN